MSRMSISSRQFANCLGASAAEAHPVNRAIDALLSHETQDAVWLRNAAQWLRENPDTSEEENPL
jgi:hypothetical protein